MVFVFFRDSNLTDVIFRLDQPFRWALDFAALDRVCVRRCVRNDHASCAAGRRWTSSTFSSDAAAAAAPWLYLTDTRAQSQPSWPFALIALTDTMVPGVMFDSFTVGVLTRVCFSSGLSGGP